MPIRFGLWHIKDVMPHPEETHTMIMQLRVSGVLVLGVLIATGRPVTTRADGYRNPPEGAYAIGAFGGHRVFADDANANIHNSANLVNLDRAMSR